MTERIVIIDHETHQVFIEDIDTDILNEKYDGEEEKYIRDNYVLYNWSWDFVTNIVYFPAEGDPIDVEPADYL